MNIYHFIYKTTSKSGKYYIGRHSTKNLNDGYFGSGKWIRSLKDKSNLTREILEFCEESELLEKEKKYLLENIGKSNCMNFNNNSMGFSSGNLNPAKSEKERKRRSLQSKGENNPAKRPEVRKKISSSLIGKKYGSRQLSEQGLENIRKSRQGRKYTEEGKKKISESRKHDYASGKRKPHQCSGWKHSEEYKKRMSEMALSRPKLTCEHCGIIAKPGPFNRWHGNNCRKKPISP